MKDIINVSGQLELGLVGNAPGGAGPRRKSRMEQAAWWFGKMRAVVDSAISWSAKPTPPPQQIWFAQTW